MCRHFRVVVREPGATSIAVAMGGRPAAPARDDGWAALRAIDWTPRTYESSPRSSASPGRLSPWAGLVGVGYAGALLATLTAWAAMRLPLAIPLRRR